MDPNFIESLRAPKERPIRVAELAEMANENKAKVLKPEFKWKGHYWTVCDLNLIMSFQRPHEEIRQVKLESIPYPNHKPFHILINRQYFHPYSKDLSALILNISQDYV